MDVSYKVIYLLKCWSTLTIDVHKGGGGAVAPPHGPIVEKRALKCPPGSQNLR